MEEKMKGLEKLIEGVAEYCTENKIEYVFAAVAENGKHVRIAHNTLANTILKESSKVIQALIGK